jgi:hypothetical protein
MEQYYAIVFNSKRSTGLINQILIGLRVLIMNLDISLFTEIIILKKLGLVNQKEEVRFCLSI